VLLLSLWYLKPCGHAVPSLVNYRDERAYKGSRKTVWDILRMSGMQLEHCRGTWPTKEPGKLSQLESSHICSKELTSWLHLYVTKDLELELEIYRSWWVGPPQARSCWFRRLSIALTLFLGTPLSQACISRSPICAHLVSTTFKFQLRLEQRELTIEQRMDGVKTSRK